MRVLGGTYGPEPQNGLLYCYEGTNITEEIAVNHRKTQLNDAIMESRDFVLDNSGRKIRAIVNYFAGGLG